MCLMARVYAPAGEKKTSKKQRLVEQDRSCDPRAVGGYVHNHEMHGCTKAPIALLICHGRLFHLCMPVLCLFLPQEIWIRQTVLASSCSVLLGAFYLPVPQTEVTNLL